MYIYFSTVWQLFDLSQGLFAEYIELLVQFGYLGLFSCVFPLTAVLLLINNLTEIRSDAYKMCKLFRKPFSPPVANMGVWQVSGKTWYNTWTPDRKKRRIWVSA